MMVKNAPYKFSEFESLSIKYGTNANLANQYNSKTGEYQYLNKQDSLIRKRVKLTKDDLLLLHRKAAQLGYWNFPSQIVNEEKQVNSETLRYIIEFNYERKKKSVVFDNNYNGDPKLTDAARRLIGEITTSINDAEDRLPD